MTIETFINKLNEIYSIQKPLNFDSQQWEDFRIIVDTCKESGFSFIYYPYNSDSYQQFKEKITDEDEVETLEYLNYAINHCEDNIKDGKLFNQSKEYQNFILPT